VLLCPRCDQNELKDPIELNAVSEIDKKIMDLYYMWKNGGHYDVLESKRIN